MTLSNEQYYRILKQVSTKLKDKGSHVWIGSILSENGLDDYKDYTRQITNGLEDRHFVATTNIHDGHKYITRLLPAANDYLREFELSKQSDKPKPSSRKWVDKILDYLDKILVGVISTFLIWLIKSLL